MQFGKRQEGERASRQESLPGGFGVRLLGDNVGNDALLLEREATHGDAGKLADARLRAIGADKQPCVEPAAVLERHGRRLGGQVERGDLDRTEVVHVGEVVQPLDERGLHQAVLDNVGKTRLAHLGGVEMNGTGTGGVPHLHLANRRDAVFHRFPYTDGLQNRDRCQRNGAHAQVIALDRRRFGGALIQHRDLEAGVAERAAEQAAYHAAAGDDNVI